MDPRLGTPDLHARGVGKYSVQRIVYYLPLHSVSYREHAEATGRKLYAAEKRREEQTTPRVAIANLLVSLLSTGRLLIYVFRGRVGV